MAVPSVFLFPWLILEPNIVLARLIRNRQPAIATVGFFEPFVLVAAFAYSGFDLLCIRLQQFISST